MKRCVIMLCLGVCYAFMGARKTGDIVEVVATEIRNEGVVGECKIYQYDSNITPNSIQVDRIIPEVPPIGKKLNIILDTDAANEIDDLYAIALLLASPDRFNIKGFVAAHFNNNDSKSGPVSIDTSFELLKYLLKIANFTDKYPIYRGAHPSGYYDYPSESEGVDFIIKSARECTSEDPLWVVALGPATDLSSAILKAPDIIPNVRFIFHARSEYSWPERSMQYNVYANIFATQSLLKKWVPLVWFDTGTNLKCDYALTEKYVKPCGEIGNFIHHYRDKNWYWKSLDKGFFDMGDIAFLVNPDICKSEIVNAPTMDNYMFFDHEQQVNGKMLRVYDIDNNAVWNMLFERMKMFQK